MNKPKHYMVSWIIDIEATTPRSAAEQALSIIQEPGTECTVFQVMDDNGKTVEVDLNVGEE